MTSSPLPPPPPLAKLLESGAVALFLDFDGTLIEIASGPDAIDVPADMAQRLGQLGARMDGRLALVSGRGLDNIAQHVGDMAIARAGSHGAHRIDASGKPLGDDPQPLGAATIETLQKLAADNDALFERKAHGAAIHYRNNPGAGPAINKAAASIAADKDLSAKHGKCVVELVRPGAEKGGAVDAFMAQPPFQGSIPIFIGDDVTDEDGFAACQRLGGFGIAVGERPSQGARYALLTVKDVHVWLNL